MSQSDLLYLTSFYASNVYLYSVVIRKSNFMGFICLYANIFISQVCYYFVCMITVCDHGQECGKAYVWKSGCSTVGWALSTINRFWGSNSMWSESMTTETILVCLSRFPIFEHGLLTRLVGLVVNFVQVAATESPYLLMISSKFIFSQIQY